jgi:uncharacterized protein with HEPN domain
LSSRRDSRSWLWDVIDAARFIERHTHGLTAKDYADNELLRSAVERKFLIIGEAINNFAKAEPELVVHIRGTSRIIGFRNFLAHGYFDVDHVLVWSIIEQDVARLVEDASRLLTGLDQRHGRPDDR